MYLDLFQTIDLEDNLSASTCREQLLLSANC